MVGNLNFAKGVARKDEENNCNCLLDGRSVDDIGLCGETRKKGGWIRSQGTVDDFYRDRTECANEARKGNGTNENFDLLFSKCMQSKGYLWQQEGYSGQENPW